MSQDLQTYASMTALRSSTSSVPDSPYVSQHDEAIVDRMKNFATNQGLGDQIYYQDEDMADLLQDFGITNPNLNRE